MQAALMSLLALVPAAVFAQNLAFLTGLGLALQNANLESTLAVITSLNKTPTGLSVLSSISNGDPYLLFAPTNNAWSTALRNTTDDALANILAYHIVPGDFSGVITRYPNTTVEETLYNNTAEDSPPVLLEDGRPQVLAWAVDSDNLTHVLNQANDTVVLNTTIFGNIAIYIIDHVLDIPQSLEVSISTDNSSLSEFDIYLHDASYTIFNITTNQTGDITFFDSLNASFSGFTLFAPNNSAVIAANSTLQSLLSNRSAIDAVLSNHIIIDAPPLYSPLLTGSRNFTSQGGETFSFSVNSTGQYVTQGDTTALIIQPDVILLNGVIHIIDSVILNTNTNSSAAAAAVTSAISAGSTATATSQTSSVGSSIKQPVSGSNSASGSTATNTPGSNAGISVFALPKQTVLGAALAVLSIVAGGVFNLV